MVAATLTDVFLPIYAGNLVSAVSAAAGGHDARALRSAARALSIMVTLGLGQQLLRYGAFIGIVRLTTRVVSEVARAAFHRVQRFSSEWHAKAENSPGRMQDKTFLMVFMLPWEPTQMQITI